MGKLTKENLIKLMAWGSIVGLVMVIVPLLALAPFDHSCADDYVYGYALHKLLENGTPSILEMLKTVIDNTCEYYMTWQGTYSSIFFMSMQPAVFSERLYVIVPFIMIGSMVGSVFIFMKVLLTKLFDAKWYHVVTLSAAVLFLTLEYVSSPVESFFWFNSAIHYTVMFSCMLLLFSCMIQLHFMEKIGIKYIILAFFLEIMVGGGNYITLLMTFILLTIFIAGEIYVYWIRKRTFREKRVYCYSILYVIYIVAAGLNMIAPGNQKRKSLFAGLSIPETIITSVKGGIVAVDYCTTIIVILTMIILVPVVLDMVGKTQYKFRYPALIVIISLGVFSSMYVPLYYSFGLLAAPGRTVNIIMEAYYILIVLNLIYILGWLRKNVIWFKEEKKVNMLCCYVVSVVTIFLGTLALGNKEQLNSYIGLQSLRTGEAQTYHKEAMARLELLENPEISEVELQPFTYQPKLLFMSEITEDVSDYKNQECARYYGKTTVRLKE